MTERINDISNKIQSFLIRYLNKDYFLQQPYLWIGLFVAVFVMFILLHQIYIRQNVVNTIISSRKKALKDIKTKDQLFADEFGAIEHKTFIYKLDRLILTSGMKKRLKFMNAETYFIMVVLGAIIGFMAGLVFGGVFLAIFIAAAVITFFHVFIASRANSNYAKIENQTSVFVSVLCNNSKGSSDIVLIMKRTLPNLSNPLYTLVRDFCNNADVYGSTDVAFDIMKESIDNKQLKVIITNLKTCSHYEANYEDVLSQMVGQITAELSYREERKTVLLNGKITVASLTVIASVILILIAKMLEIPIQEIMFNMFIGKVLCTIMGLIYLYVIASLFAVDRT